MMEDPGHCSSAQSAEDSANKQFESEEFRLYCYKILPCSKRYSHDWSQCPYAHPSERAKRRDFRIYKYDCIMCPAIERGEECPKGLNCAHSHNAFESWLHPQKYRTLICKDRDNCNRPVCFFAHGSYDLRMPCEPEPPAPPTVQLQDATGRHLGPQAPLLMSSSGGCHQQTGRFSADYSRSSISSLQVQYVSAAPADAISTASCGMYGGGVCVMSPVEFRSPEEMVLQPSGLMPTMNTMQQVQQLPTQRPLAQGVQLVQQVLPKQHLAGQQHQVAVTNAVLLPTGIRAAVATSAGPPQIAGQLRTSVTALQPQQIAANPLAGPAQPQPLQPCQQQLLTAQQHQLQQTGLLQSQQLQRQLQQLQVQPQLLQVQPAQAGRGLLDAVVNPATDAGPLGWVGGGPAERQQAQALLTRSYDGIQLQNQAIRQGAVEAGSSIMPSAPTRRSLDQLNVWPLVSGGSAVNAQVLSPTASASVSNDLSAGQALLQRVQGGSPLCVGSPAALGLVPDPFAATSSFNNLMAAATPATPMMQQQLQQMPAGSLDVVKQAQMPCVPRLQQLTTMNRAAHQGLGVGFADATTSVQQLGSSWMHEDQLSSLLPQMQQLGGNNWDESVAAGLMSLPALQRGALPQQQQAVSIGSSLIQQQQQQQQQQLLVQGMLRGLTPISAGITLLG